ncbi:MAG TPA: HAD family hydrolase [Ktedonobacterales bacterium]|nr:HAD family hydrolase [Ktedonobacterales bacterium]
MAQWVVLLDDGGVMNDNRLRGPQWQRLVAEFFAPRLGGASEAWAKANRAVIKAMLEPSAWQKRLQSAQNFHYFDRTYQLDWLKDMCTLVGVVAPDDDACYELARQATALIIPQIRSAFPGAVEAIRTLFRRGYQLYTASSGTSTDLAGYLDGMGVRDCFQRLYGPDLINTLKNGSDFYERLFADAGVTPAEALVVDDSPQAVEWATRAGARAVLVGQASAALDDAVLCIASLAELPGILQDIEPYPLDMDNP